MTQRYNRYVYFTLLCLHGFRGKGHNLTLLDINIFIIRNNAYSRNIAKSIFTPVDKRILSPRNLLISMPLIRSPFRKDAATLTNHRHWQKPSVECFLRGSHLLGMYREISKESTIRFVSEILPAPSITMGLYREARRSKAEQTS